jgi:solute carrier family 34 (sodium-dependent phosphate cotransporter)
MADTVQRGTTSEDATLSIASIILRIALILFLVYIFILSIKLMGGSFKLFGKDFAAAMFSATSNPLVALMIGVFTTAIVQSSSFTTSSIVGLVASGVLPLEAAIPMVMGANIGTSVTNILVSIGSISRGDEFKRAFGGSLLHDIFNICAVVVLLPLQIYFDLIGKSAAALESLFTGFGGMQFTSPLSVITKPVANSIIELTGNSGWISAIVAMLLLFIALRYIVKVLKSLVLSKVEKFFQRFVFRTPILSFTLGIALTAAVQSSSITTSLIVPLIGAGILQMEQIYPYLLGANIGTTITAFLASFVAGSPAGVSVAFAHLIFNIYGIGIFWPAKKIPIWLSKKMANLTQKSKLIPILYIIVVFFIIPGAILFFAD